MTQPLVYLSLQPSAKVIFLWPWADATLLKRTFPNVLGMNTVAVIDANTVELPVSGHPRDLVKVSAYRRLHVTMQTMGRSRLYYIRERLVFLDNQDFDFWGYYSNWPPVKRLLYFTRPLYVEKLIQLFKAISWCLGVHFPRAVCLRELFFCWDLRIGVRVRVRLWEVSV